MREGGCEEEIWEEVVLALVRSCHFFFPPVCLKSGDLKRNVKMSYLSLRSLS